MEKPLTPEEIEIIYRGRQSNITNPLAAVFTGNFHPLLNSFLILEAAPNPAMPLSERVQRQAREKLVYVSEQLSLIFAESGPPNLADLLPVANHTRELKSHLIGQLLATGYISHGDPDRQIRVPRVWFHKQQLPSSLRLDDLQLMEQRLVELEEQGKALNQLAGGHKVADLDYNQMAAEIEKSNLQGQESKSRDLIDQLREYQLPLDIAQALIDLSDKLRNGIAPLEVKINSAIRRRRPNSGRKR